jgi:hypothetical protein
MLIIQSLQQCFNIDPYEINRIEEREGDLSAVA